MTHADGFESSSYRDLFSKKNKIKICDFLIFVVSHIATFFEHTLTHFNPALHFT